MKFLIDENLPPGIAYGFQEFKKNVVHVNDVYGSGTSDIQIFNKIGKNNDVIMITKDKNIRRKPHERQALIQNDIKIFFISRQNLKFWDIIKLLVSKWEDIEHLSSHHSSSFGFKIDYQGKIEKLWCN